MRSHFRCIWLGIVFLAVVAAVTSCKKQKEAAPEKAAEPWPVAAVWAWGDTIAYQDNAAPSFVVYSDGRLILKKVAGDPWSLPRKPPTVKYLTKYLTAEELADFEESVLAVVKEPPADELPISPCLSHEDSASFFFGTQGKGFVSCVNGLSLTQPEDEGSIGVNFGTAKISASLLKYCVGLRLLKLTGLEPWQPAQLTVEFLRSSSSGGQRLHWPDSWPIPDSPNPNQSDGKMYLNFEINKQPEIEQLLQTNRRGEYSEIVAGGKNYLAGLRLYFPGEEAWRSAFPTFVELGSFVQPVERPLRKPVVPRPALPTDALK